MVAEYRRTIKLHLVKLYGLKCGYCFHKTPYKQLTIDHIQPLSKGGADKPDNMLLSCWECNQLKGAMSAEEWLEFLEWE